jgi:hypothetical protein
MIGFVGLNYLYQPSVAVAGYLKILIKCKSSGKMIILHPVKII